MSELLQPDVPQPASGGADEEVDAVVVAPVPRALPARVDARAAVPVVQAAAVAAGSFLAGATMVGLAHRHQRRRELIRAGAKRRFGRDAGRRRNSSGMGELVQIVGSRSLLVDVHLLGGRN